MNKKSKKLVIRVCYFLFALMTIIIFSSNIGIAKQVRVNAPVSEYQNNIVAYGYKTKVFGRQGRSGRDGRNGNYGRRGKNIRVFVDGTAAKYYVSGDDGGDGDDGSYGENARFCRVSRRPSFSVKGAGGGDGGDGGNGGKGGNGGNVTIYYQNRKDLKKITVNNSGGKGGSPGRSAEGGDGCNCRKKEWKVNYCEWNLYKKNRNIKDAKWIFDSKKRVACTGIKRVDERENYPSLPNSSSTWAYRWEYQGVYSTRRYTCTDGKRGRDGRDGRFGRKGKYGKVTLVPRSDIPKEKTVYRGELSQQLEKNIELVKNIWVRKRDLGLLLSPDSDVPNTYRYLQETARPQYKIVWKARKSPAELGVEDTEIRAGIKVEDTQAKIYFQVPGTLEYQRSKDNNIELLNITGGFSPSRIKSFEIENISGSGEDTKLSLIDKGDVRKLLRGSRIQVTLKTKQSASGQIVDNYYKFRHEMKFYIPPFMSPSTGVTVSGNRYMINLGRYFSPWLKAGYDAEFDIEISQKTKSGYTYTDNKKETYKLPE